MKNISQKLKIENKIILFLVVMNLFSFMYVINGYLILVLLLFAIIAGKNYHTYTHNTPINEKTLSELKSFGLEDNGCFSDRAEFNIRPITNPVGRTEWYLEHFDEVDGSTSFIKRLESLNDLKRVYSILTDKELI